MLERIEALELEVAKLTNTVNTLLLKTFLPKDADRKERIARLCLETARNYFRLPPEQLPRRFKSMVNRRRIIARLMRDFAGAGPSLIGRLLSEEGSNVDHSTVIYYQKTADKLLDDLDTTLMYTDLSTEIKGLLNRMKKEEEAVVRGMGILH